MIPLKFSGGAGGCEAPFRNSGTEAVRQDSSEPVSTGDGNPLTRNQMRRHWISRMGKIAGKIF